MTHYLKPINNTAIIEMLEKEKISTGGIILTRNDPKEITKGRVLAIGPNCKDIKEGDIILPNWNAARKNDINDETFFVISEDEIIAILD
ncbi:GroS Co-chaperonin GroES (HSP10) [uncultured Caudovirales phage]|jgi:chaperonin GroES|uniref:GroS Co-chaperonin GroES (HSP10) n=1 Tax=uncultured Caudovirales phage TaxID=2100421 RepID=A0A6J5T6F3_9CAUD|nr:GroS Co-chaperonin GroES (HSP10) [uncultured Caudovirales phage]